MAASMLASQLADNVQGKGSWRMDEALEVLSDIIFDKVKRRCLLDLKDSDAQSMIDYLYMLSLHPDFSQLAPSTLRKHIFIVLRKLCESSMIYPTCYTLDGIEDIVPKDGGGFCDIYQGRHQGNNLCLKVVRLYEKQDQDEVLKAFAREAILWGQLEHPNIMPFYGIFYLKESYERICLLSPWMENGNIMEYLKREPQVPRRPFLYDIASGLGYLHSEKIVHGDLKGANVLIDQFSRARLTDFGLSKTLTDGTLGFTTTKLAFGRTTNWASPELLEENACHTPESDIWAFGCVCYEIMTGLFPFHGLTEVQVVRNLISRRLPAQSSIDRLDPDDAVNRKIWELVELCWLFKVTQRPKCREILQTMENDALTWQPRGGGANDEAGANRQFQCTARTLESPPPDHSRARQLLEDVISKLGGDKKEVNEGEARILVRSQSSGTSVFTGRDQKLLDIHNMFPLFRLSPCLSLTSRGGSTEQDLNTPPGTFRSSNPAYLGNFQHPGRHLPLASASNAFNHTKPASTQQPLEILAASRSLMTSSRRSVNSQDPVQLSGQDLSRPRHNNYKDMFSLYHGATRPESALTYGNTLTNSSDQFMKELQERIIPGVQFDSPDRDPPPRCHHGTRLAILDRCLDFIRNSNGQEKIFRVYGAAGVGKSAIMQSIAESPELLVSCHASIFFSSDGRNDGAKVVLTVCYQFAAKFEPYRRLIEEEIKRDPSLLRSSMEKQFLKLIVEPFIHNLQLDSAGRFLIIIDGLEQCRDSRVQLELLRLISVFCIKYPSSPIVWLIATPYDTIIGNLLWNAEVKSAHQREEIKVDVDDARADVERFLWDKLVEIRKKSGLLDSQWPDKRDFRKLANASGGFFAYAAAVIRYISNPSIGNPASRLSHVLSIIDKYPMIDVPREDHPLALLDELYARAMPRITIDIRKLLLTLTSYWNQLGYDRENFIVLGNWLGMTFNEAYTAADHLLPVCSRPWRENVHRQNLEPRHPSFIDYISDSTRSGLFKNLEYEAQQLKIECTFRILQEAPDGISFGNVNYGTDYGSLARGPGTGDKISITWSSSEHKINWNDNETRMRMYKLANAEVVAGMKRRDPTFQNEFCVRLLTTRFQSYSDLFPYDELRDFVLDEVRRPEFTIDGILKQVPSKDFNMSRNICDLEVRVRFQGPATRKYDSWNSSCEHEREGVWEEGNEEHWTTTFRLRECSFCSERFDRQLKSQKTQSPDHIVTVLFSSTGECCLENRFVDPQDNASVWIYWVWCKISLDVRKKYGGPEKVQLGFAPHSKILDEEAMDRELKFHYPGTA